jgi:hypothetical protein
MLFLSLLDQRKNTPFECSFEAKYISLLLRLLCLLSSCGGGGLEEVVVVERVVKLCRCFGGFGP